MLLLPLSAWADFTTLSVEQVQAKIEQGVAIIDVRRQDEYDQYGVIPNSHKMPFFDKNGQYNLQAWLSDLAKAVPNQDTPFVLVCAYANRTKTIGRFLHAKTGYKNIFELAGGINGGWLKQGLATTKIAAGAQQKPWYRFW